MGFGISDLTSIFSRPKPQDVPKAQGTIPDASQLFNDMDKTYKVESQNWYSAKPYGFKMSTRDGGTFTMFLPISPSNLNIQTPFATNIIPTLYGTVEEHSDVRYFDISIEGTTGMAPQFVKPGAGQDAATIYSQLRQSGRTGTPIAGSISAGGFFAKTLALANQIKGKAADLLDGGPKPKTGIVADNSGYVAFHNLYRFLLQYKKDAAGTGGSTAARQSHPLTFFNYKDNNQYDVVVRSFSMRKSAENPNLYYYSIQLRGYNLRSISSPINDNLTQRLKDLGINGVDSSSVLGDIKSISSQAKGILGSFVGGISVLGR
jgi:hypothetical protein